MEDLRSDLYKYLDVIKHEITVDEYIDIVRQGSYRAFDILLEQLKRGIR